MKIIASYKSMKTRPNDVWLTHLRQGNVVYLVKEGAFATIEWEYEAPGPQSVCGRIGLRFSPHRKDTWFIHQDGTGMDSSQLLMPVEGHFPATPPELPPEDIKHILRRLEALERFLFGGRRVLYAAHDGTEVQG